MAWRKIESLVFEGDRMNVEQEGLEEKRKHL